MSGVGIARLVAVAIIMVTVAGCASRQAAVDASVPGLGASATPGSKDDFSLNVGDRVFFTVDQVTLSNTAKATLQRQAAWLRLYPQISVTIEGHADERGTREYNIGLSAQRSEVTRSYLASLGVEAHRMRTISFGKERPVAACETEACWSQNRRAVTVLTQVGSG
ncbi:MAG: peptidoglycan-associated lipoprotein Pal [Rhizobiales bacterium]|nr:peptidoglycan-associated lipoprotein Pal [Hyphomicrobiales bacterium]